MSTSPRSSRAGSPTGTSPTRRRQSTSTVPHGFRAPPRPRQTPIGQMSVRELREAHERNAKILTAPTPSSSTYVQRISAEQARIEARLVELVGVDEIRRGLQNTTIDSEGKMSVDSQSQSTMPRAIGAKQRALARYAPQPSQSHVNPSDSMFTLQEAIEIEREAHQLELQRQRDIIDKKRRQGIPIPGEVLSRKEQEARIWAFMNHKPTDSDLEDDSDEDDDPSTWWDEDDNQDGIKGQQIVEPDEVFSDVIRIDTTRIPYNTLYESES
ncbi:hypothetical protein PUNSTDRAFT_132647 [Punctularia strigosozonata HHB-11173 SS5]|uniref:uncharacterized protein n=1 Tax=Punctularia strigosozonata (strain HHB-11173) TaxID=741275 RepID=UPI00044164DE|nr:uncharacterized protein PUNSTDRAFT_132647 [Punctularia strigosozonata HHB-11173 SS5]EIN10559.1 hypothetical protein PUNSTDRAFT_132647 [Punctularia strigosozonata HHB-11173 SS5]